MGEKKALAILYSPKTLIDFTWYYYTYGNDYKWDVLIIACDKELKIKDECEKSGMFEHIYCEDTNYDKISRFQQGWIFVKMFFAWMFGKKKKYVRWHFEKKGIELNYNLHLISSNYCSLDSGLLQCFADEIPTAILEDGMSDYLPRTYRFDKNAVKNFDALIAYIMCKMNYASLNQDGTAARYVTKNSRLCDKYSIHPERMQFTDYKSVNRLGDLSNTDSKGYYECLNRMYDLGGLEHYKADVVLFTTPMSDFCSESNYDYSKKTVDYIMKEYDPRKVLIKKHPRDRKNYDFPENVDIYEIPSFLPGELMIELLDVKKHVFMHTSALLMSYKSYDDVVILFNEYIAENSTVYKKAISQDANNLHFPKDRMVTI